MTDKVSDEQKDVPLETSLTELQEIVEFLEGGEGGLEDMITNYEKGMKIIAHCRNLLKTAECSIKILQESSPNEH